MGTQLDNPDYKIVYHNLITRMHIITEVRVVMAERV